MNKTPHYLKMARLLAAEYHGQQRQLRPGSGLPYILHVAAVAAAVADDPKAEAVAWLHDTLEDTKLMESDLRLAGIPADVIEAVVLLTHRDNAIYETYVRRLAQNPLAARVKRADMLHNISDHASRAQILKYAKGLRVLLEEGCPNDMDDDGNCPRCRDQGGCPILK